MKILFISFAKFTSAIHFKFDTLIKSKVIFKK